MIILTLIFLTLLLLFPLEVSSSVAASIDMCLKNVIPSLFPFMTVSNLILAIKPKRKHPLFLMLSSLFKISYPCANALILGLLCGYPVGGQILVTLCERGEITEKEKERALPYVNNPGPGFAIGTVGGMFFGSVKTGVVIYLSCILSSVTCALISSFFYKSSEISFFKKREEKNILIQSIKNSVEGCINITGIIAFFASVIALFELVPYFSSFPLKGLFYGLLEMTNGVKFIALSHLSFRLKCAASSFIITFSGLSILLQLKYFSEKINTAAYFLSKLLCGILSFVYCLLLI